LLKNLGSTDLSKEKPYSQKIKILFYYKKVTATSCVNYHFETERFPKRTFKKMV